ncbi:protealysin inhibitor emfourin [Microbacterium sp. F1-18]
MPDTEGGTSSPLRIVVERSGGFAGLTRTWRVEPSDAERGPWLELVRRCPWDASAPPAPSASAPGADRFRWHIVVSDSEATHQADLADDLTSPWRSLVDAVRSGQPPEPEDRQSPGPS